MRGVGRHGGPHGIGGRKFNAAEFYSVDIVGDLAIKRDNKVGRGGRRPGDARSRDAIIAAARRQFGRLGYDATTIRAVAREAGVDPALVIYFFGSKDRLFAASVDWPFDPAAELPAVIGDRRSGVGERLVRLMLETWDAEDGRNTIVALLRAAMSQETASATLRAFLESQILAPLTASLGCDQPDLRAALVASQLVGLGIARHVLRLEPLASLDREAVVALVGPQVQRSLTHRL
jgi:AcrR family transcriptional regulator